MVQQPNIRPWPPGNTDSVYKKFVSCNINSHDHHHICTCGLEYHYLYRLLVQSISIQNHIPNCNRCFFQRKKLIQQKSILLKKKKYIILHHSMILNKETLVSFPPQKLPYDPSSYEWVQEIRIYNIQMVYNGIIMIASFMKISETGNEFERGNTKTAS